MAAQHSRTITHPLGPSAKSNGGKTGTKTTDRDGNLAFLMMTAPSSRCSALPIAMCHVYCAILALPISHNRPGTISRYRLWETIVEKNIAAKDLTSTAHRASMLAGIGIGPQFGHGK